MAEFIRELCGYPGNGDQESALRELNAQTRAVEVAVLPDSHRIETRLYGDYPFGPKDSSSHLLFRTARELPEEDAQSYVKPPESLFDGAWPDGHLVYSRERAALTGLVIFSGIKEAVPAGIQVKLKVGAETIENPDQLRRSLTAKRVIPFPLE